MIFFLKQGKSKHPKKNLNYDEKGIASWYGPKFHGKLTANGEIFNQYNLTAAHKTLPIPSAVKVTNLKNNKSLIVRINDRGPFVNDRIIDLSYQSAKKLKLLEAGTGFVRVQLLRSESLLLEKLAKKGQFPEINEITKKTTPPINQVNYSNVSIQKIGETNLSNKSEEIFKKNSPAVLYGGSVDGSNVEMFKEIKEIDGFLVGGASKTSKKFIDIIKNYYR